MEHLGNVEKQNKGLYLLFSAIEILIMFSVVIY